ncbi:hypothetical protein VDS42_22550 [Xanthomonas campestris pv. campestris]|nr:hypothetical protein [Xanthomonas campestris pv. campestris]
MMGSEKSREHARTVAKKLRSDAGAGEFRQHSQPRVDDHRAIDSGATAEERTAQALVAANELLDMWARSFPLYALVVVLLSSCGAIALIHLGHFKAAVACVLVSVLASIAGYALNLDRYLSR